MMRRRIFSCLLTLMLMLSFFTPISHATGFANVDKNLVDYLNAFYSNPARSEVIDKNGNNMTSRFFTDTAVFYSNDDFLSIKNYLYQYVDTIGYLAESLPDISTFALDRPMSVSKRCVKFLPSTGMLTGFYVIYNLSGAFYYNPNTSAVTSVSSCTISGIDYEDKPSGIYPKVSNLSTSYRISGNSVTFYGSFRVVGYSEPNYSAIINDYGIVSNEVTGVAP